jgi:drug/metabolite transporter (DMT)-like permease
MRLFGLALAPTTTTQKNRLYGIAYLCLSCFFWAAVELTGYFVPSGYSALETVWARYSFHILFMLIVFGPSQRTNLIRTHSLKLQLFRPVLMIGMPIFFLLGIHFLSEEAVLTVFWTAPFMVLVLAAILLKEQITLPYWLATIAGFVGVLAILQPSVPLLFSWTIILPIGMAFCFSFYFVLTRILHAENTVTNLFYTGLVVSISYSFGLPYFWKNMNITALLTMSIIGFLGFWVLYFLDKALEQAPASILAPFLYVQPIFALILGSLLFRQSPSFLRLVGSFGLIGIGIFLTSLRTQSEG